MIQLQADPLIEWDETVPTMKGQTIDAQLYVGKNILNTTPVNIDETVHSVVQDADWKRIASQSYTSSGFVLSVVRTYKDIESCAIASCSYTLAII